MARSDFVNVALRQRSTGERSICYSVSQGVAESGSPAILARQNEGWGMAWDALKGWTGAQKHAVAAAYLGWTLDAFDFFVLTFVMPDVAKQFDVNIPAIALALTLTLAVRPLGAFLFGRLADDYGRRPI